jgi:hypothetical protein
MLWSQPRPIRAMAKIEGWTPETILDHVLPAFRPDMYDLGNARVVTPWDPV